MIKLDSVSEPKKLQKNTLRRRAKMRVEKVVEKLERAGYFVVESEISKQTYYAMGNEHIIVIDGHDGAANKTVAMMPIRYNNIEAFCNELKSVFETHTDIRNGTRKAVKVK